MKRISFIITYYNEPLQVLNECVQSVLSLSLNSEEREILLIDDGSTIPAPEMDGVTVVRQENQGLSAARNKGIELAQGKYIQFLDADDCLLPDAYQHVLDLLSLHQPDMLMFGFTRSASAGKRGLRGVKLFLSGSDFLRTRNMRASAWAYLFRRNILGDLRFYPGILHEDELFTPQLLLRAQKVVLAKVSPYFYRIGADTIMHQRNAAHIQRRMQDMLFVLQKLNWLAKAAQGAEREGLQRRVSQLTMDTIFNCWMLNRNHKAVLSCLRSLRGCGLFPLSTERYTLKYWLFSLTVNSLCVFL